VDLLSFIGLVLGLASILLGNILEGSHLSAIMQPTAALIVFGGTAGATILASTGDDLRAVMRMVPRAFFGGRHDLRGLVAQILDLSKVTRREGVLALEPKLEEVHDPFFARGLRQVIDGTGAAELRQSLETNIGKDEERDGAAGKVFEAAGGFAPTVGILGAVLGLIHVMQSLNDPSKLGEGIAVAFVATVYGVGFANLISLPLAEKIKKRVHEDVEMREVVLEGLVGIAAGQPTSLLAQNLAILVGGEEKAPGAAGAAVGAEAAAQPA
jgi:chemotaxis protein MotA